MEPGFTASVGELLLSQQKQSGNMSETSYSPEQVSPIDGDTRQVGVVTSVVNLLLQRPLIH